MTLIGDELKKALDAKNNDVKSFTWKMARKSDGTQEEVRMVDCTQEQLSKFYHHCMMMLHNTDKVNPGRYPLLDIIAEQREKCNAELFLRKLESGAIVADGKPYPRHLYIQDLRTFITNNKAQFPTNEWKTIPISTCMGGLPREFERLSIDSVITAGLDGLG